MLTAYINYPQIHINVYRNRTCSSLQIHDKPEQRVVTINKASLDSELARFKAKEYRFASTAEFNDMWVDVDLDDESTELGVVEKIRELLAQHYRPFAEISVNPDC